MTERLSRAAASEETEATRAARAGMIALVRRHAAATVLDGKPVRLDERVLAAMADVPRHLFAPGSEPHEAYEDHPIPIGHRQTMSQPFIVALMSSLARIKAGDRVLEIGTGSGYQAAILSRLAAEIYSIEIVAPLAHTAAAILAGTGCGNVETRIGDGYAGWPEKAPFDAIVVTAAAGHVPPALLSQLQPGGRLVIPVGDDRQDLLVIEKAADGTALTRNVIPVRFVPLVHGEETSQTDD